MTQTSTMWRGFVCAVGAVTLLAVGMDAQEKAPEKAADKALPQFEVASIKPNKSGDRRIMIGVQPGGRFTATNVTVQQLIRNAYQLQDFQLVGGPSWLTEDHYDIVAKAESDGAGDPFRAEKRGEPSRGQLMLRALLAERFKLVVRTENREMPIYALVLARSDGKFGPQLQKAAIDCSAGPPRPPGAGTAGAGPAGGPGAAPGAGAGPMAGPGAGPGPGPGPGPGAGPGGPGGPGGMPPPGPGSCGIRIAPGNMAVGGSSMSLFANSLGTWVGRIVVDKTGLEGAYDFTLTWTPDQMPQRPPGAPEMPIDPNGPSIFTAVQEQLGLKLDSQKGPVSVLVIDHVEHPVED
jgi:uncharacterized protein (TIGR03435 family)